MPEKIDLKTFPSPKRWYKKWWVILLLVLLVVAAFWLFGFIMVLLGFSSNTTITNTPIVNVSVDNDPFLGNPQARVVIVGFEDFECPYCAQAAPIMKQVMQKYGDRVQYVFRDFPLLSVHQHAMEAAEAAECANEQGKFWEMHDYLFANQSNLDNASLKKYALALGLDMVGFTDCLDHQKYRDEIMKDYQDGVQAGVTATPTWFINGRVIRGVVPFDVWEKAIKYFL